MTDLDSMNDDELRQELGDRMERFIRPGRSVAIAAFVGYAARRQEISIGLPDGPVVGFLAGLDEEYVQLVSAETGAQVMVAWDRIDDTRTTGRDTSDLEPDLRKAVEDSSHTLWIKAKEIKRAQMEIRRRKR